MTLDTLFKVRTLLSYLLFFIVSSTLAQERTDSVILSTTPKSNSSATEVNFNLILQDSVSSVELTDFLLLKTSQVSTAKIDDISAIQNGYSIRVVGIPENSDGYLKLVYSANKEKLNEASLKYKTDEISAYHFVGAAYDVSRIPDMSAPEGIYPIDIKGSLNCLVFSPDGMSIFIIDLKLDRLLQYRLSSPYDLSSIEFYAELPIDAFATNAMSINFDDSGQELFILDNPSKGVYQFHLEKPYDITAVQGKPFKLNMDLPKNPGSPVVRGMSFGTAGQKLFITAGNDPRVYIFKLQRPYQLAKAIYVGAKSVLGYKDEIWTNRSHVYRPDGKKAFFSHGAPQINEYTLSQPFDLATASYNGKEHQLILGTRRLYSATSFIFNTEGTKLFVLNSGRGYNQIDEFDLNSEEFKIDKTDLVLKRLEGKKDTLISYLGNKAKVRLNHWDNDFIMKLQSNSINAKDSVFFQYRIGDESWSNWTKSEQLDFERLNYGSYDFQFRAKNKHGQLSDIVSLSFVIKTPWYISTQAIAAYILLLILVVIVIVKVNQHKLKTRNKKLERIVAERTEEISNKMKEVEAANVKINDQAKRLKELDQVKSRFFANISHELKTPLTLINAPIAALLDKPKLDEKETRQNLEIAQKNGSRLLSLVEEILDLTKLEAGKLKLTQNPVNLNEFLEGLVAEYSIGFSQKNIQFHYRFELANGFSVMLDTTKTSKILNNLLSNALKFTPEHGEISFVVRYKANAPGILEISVEDSGEGIHPNDLPHIFNRFYQAEEGQKKALGGTGIGLALAKELAGLFNGSLHVNSALGKGSVFTFSFPFEETDYVTDIVPVPTVGLPLEKSIQATIEQYAKKFEIEKPVVLVTEDHPDMRAFISGHLAQYFEVLQAENGKVAYEILKSEKIDIIISDVMMPVMDGFELLEAIKKDASLNQVSIVMLTARGASEDKLYALALGIDDYLTKPFDPSEFLARIKNILDNRIKIIKELGAISADDNGSNEDLEAFIKLHDISDHEYQILKFIAKRYSNKEIGEALGLSANTIKYHLKKLYFKLGISTRQEMYDRVEEVLN